jgi:hypothetical protein
LYFWEKIEAIKKEEERTIFLHKKIFYLFKFSLQRKIIEFIRVHVKIKIAKNCAGVNKIKRKKIIAEFFKDATKLMSSH